MLDIYYSVELGGFFPPHCVIVFTFMIEQQRSNTLSEVGGWVIDYHWSSIDRSEQSKKEKK